MELRKNYALLIDLESALAYAETTDDPAETSTGVSISSVRVCCD
jgi:hypothetical protein